MKKIVALALCFVMVVGLLAGCEKPMDAQTLAQKMDEAIAAQSAMSAKLAMELAMTMGITGMTMDMGMDMNMEAKSAMNGEKSYIKGTMTMEILGQKEESSMEMYMNVADGVGTVYTYTEAEDRWIKQEEAIPEDLQSTTLKLSELPAENLVLAEEKELLGEKEYYVLNVTYSGADAKAYIDSFMGTAAAEMDEETKAVLESMDLSGVTAVLVYHVDPDTFLPVQSIGEVQGMGEAMNQVIGTVMGEMLGELGGEGMEFTVDVPTCKINMTDVVYGDVEIPDVPQEAIDNAIDADDLLTFEEEPVVDDSMLGNPAQADGSFLLSCEGDKARIVIPEGFVPYVSEQDSLVIVTDDYMNSATYGLITDVTDEYMREYVAEMLTYAQEEDYYLSHTEPAELNGFTVATQVYNDGTGAFYAWKQLDASVLVVEVYFLGESYDGAPLLSGVEIIAE